MLGQSCYRLVCFQNSSVHFNNSTGRARTVWWNGRIRKWIWWSCISKISCNIVSKERMLAEQTSPFLTTMKKWMQDCSFWHLCIPQSCRLINLVSWKEKKYLFPPGDLRLHEIFFTNVCCNICRINVSPSGLTLVMFGWRWWVLRWHSGLVCKTSKK